MLSKELYRTYVQILKDELVPAMGCTEPIAIAYAGAVARKTLGAGKTRPCKMAGYQDRRP